MHSIASVLPLLLLVGSLLQCPANALPAPGVYGELERVKESYNAISGRQCIRQCQAKCGGICYMTMSFQYICNCKETRFGRK